MPYKDKDIAKQKSKDRWKTWAQRNPEKSNQRMKEWRDRNPKYMLHISAKRRALKDNIVFSITIEDVPDIPDICPITSIPIHTRNDGTKGPCDNSPSLDRIDNTLGYVKDNIRVISYKGNRWKSNMSIQDVENLLQYMKQK